MKIEIIEGYNKPVSTEINKKDGSKGIVYAQKCYLHTNSAFPVEFELPLKDLNQAYQVGFYTLSPESFRVNNYGGLELNRYDIHLVSSQANLKKAV